MNIDPKKPWRFTTERPYPEETRGYCRRHMESPGFAMRFIGGVILLCLVVVLFVLMVGTKKADAQEIQPAGVGRIYDAERIADAIWHAEGGKRAKKPYGVLSVPCHSEAQCRRICINTIQNNFTRWQANGARGDFLVYLASRYAPVGVKNDPRGLNRHWLKNVRHYYDTGSEVR